MNLKKLIIFFLCTIYINGYSEEVGGLINGDTIWSNSNEEYFFTEDVTIANGSLKILPGVSINGNGKRLLITNKLDATGNNTSIIKFNNIKISPITEGAILNYSWCMIDKSNIFYLPSSAVNASFNINNSIVSNHAKYLNIYYPDKDINIFNNTFWGYSGLLNYECLISAGINGNRKINITSNIFHQSSSGIGIIENWAMYPPSQMIVEKNNFVSMDAGKYIFHLISGYENADMLIPNNYYGTIVDDEINKLIRDKVDDLSIPVKLNYKPYLVSANRNAGGPSLNIQVDVDRFKLKKYGRIEAKIKWFLADDPSAIPDIEPEIKWIYNGRVVSRSNKISIKEKGEEEGQLGYGNYKLEIYHHLIRSNFYEKEFIFDRNFHSPKPKLFLNNKLTQSRVSATTGDEVNLTTSYDRGMIYFTKNGSDPNFESFLFKGPFKLNKSTVVRSIAYNKDFTESSEAKPIIIDVLPNYNLKLISDGDGVILSDPKYGPYVHNSVVSLLAVSNDGWEFSHWIGDHVGSHQEANIVIERESSITAIFKEITSRIIQINVDRGGFVSIKSQDSSFQAEVDPRDIGQKQYSFKLGTKLTLKAVSNDIASIGRFKFVGWKGDFDRSNSQIRLTINDNKNVSAIFGTDIITLTTGKGKLILDPPNGPYPYGTKVNITPVPDAGYYLGVWGADAAGMPKAPIEFEITKANPEITALFVPLKENRFTVTTLATAGGSVVSNPNSNAYVNGQEVTLTATPEAGYSFVGWTGDIESTSNPLVTLADANKTVTAEFRRNIIAPVTLTINAENGTVTRTPSDGLYEKGTSVELLAQANPGYTFTGWAGALGGTASRTTLFLDDDKSITANFKASYQLAAETRGPGSVLTTPSSTTFIDGDEVILTASPAEGYGFVGWTGDLESTDQQTTLAMDSNKRVIAHFAQLGTLTTWTRGEGTITRSPDKESYFPGAKVTLTAKPGDGFQFVSWDGQASGTSNPTTVTMDRAMSVAANFKDIKAPTVTITSPAAQETGNETFTLSGAVTDNGKIKTLVWLWKGQEMGELELVDGKFELKDQKLAGGANTITVVATDRSGNEGKATVNPTWIADRSIRIAAAKEQQEGNRIEVPIEINSKGNVGGMGFVLNYDHSYLMDPVLTWSSAAGGSINLVNSEIAGELKGTFSLGGTSLPGGDQLIGTVSFRARSVPESLETVLGLQDLSISDSNGNKMTSGTDVVSGRARVLVRDITGDNNANDRLDVGDATRIQRLLVGLDRARAWDVSSNDLNGSGDLDPGDVVKVLRTVVGIDPQPNRNRVIAKMGGDDEAVETAMLLIKEKTASTVTVQVQLKDMASTIAGANFQLEYPAELLKLKDKSSHAPGEIVAGNAAAIWNVSPAQTDYTKQDGTLAIAVSSPEPWTTKNGVLAEISFDVQDGADLNQAVLALSQVEVTPDGFDNRMLSGSSFNVGSGETDKPTEPSEVEIIGIENAPFGFSFKTEMGTSYEVQASDDLQKWQQLREVKGTGEVVKFLDFRKAIYEQQYYRVRLVE